MTKGGYQIIDLSGYSFTNETSVDVKDIYEKFEGNRKAILISGLDIDGVEVRDFFAQPYIEDSNFVVEFKTSSADIYTMRIGTASDGNDTITIVNNR